MPFRFILLPFLKKNPSPNKDCEKSETVKELWFVIRCIVLFIVFRSDTTQAVDLALKHDDLLTYLPLSRASRSVLQTDFQILWLLKKTELFSSPQSFLQHSYLGVTSTRVKEKRLSKPFSIASQLFTEKNPTLVLKIFRFSRALSSELPRRRERSR